MTTLVLSYSTSLLERFLGGLKSTLKAVMIGYMVARQTSANTHLARLLIESGEYNRGEHDYHTILADLNRKTIDNIHKEFGA